MDSYRLENTIENETNLITKLIFEPTTFCNPYNFKFVITNGKCMMDSIVRKIIHFNKILLKKRKWDNNLEQ